jgi:hypothetical protein
LTTAEKKKFLAFTILKYMATFFHSSNPDLPTFKALRAILIKMAKRILKERCRKILTADKGAEKIETSDFQ